MIIRPNNPINEVVATIQIDNDQILVKYGMILKVFNDLVKSLKYRWNSRITRWYRLITNLNGPLEDRLIELACNLLANQFIIDVDQKYTGRIQHSDYSLEITRWILRHKDSFRMYWAYGEYNYFDKVKQITQARYKKSLGIVVPQRHYAEVEDFADIYRFTFSNQAKSLLSQAKADRGNCLIVGDIKLKEYHENTKQKAVLNKRKVQVLSEFIDFRNFKFDTLTSLYAHQEIALEKISELTIGALFMDMGTGKTRVAIELSKLRQARISNVIWFCPLILTDTIFQELKKHTNIPNGEIYTFNNKTNKRSIPKDKFWYIVGMESIGSSRRVVNAVLEIVNQNSFAIVDESSYIKGHNSNRTTRITDICQKTKYKLLLTGTPISQGFQDLYAQMKFLSPKILNYNSFYSFADNHLIYSDKYPGMIVRTFNTDYITSKIQPYSYQVTKEEAGIDLPPKLYDTVYFDLTTEQKEAYQTAKYSYLMTSAVDELGALLQLFSELQQIVSGFYKNDKDTIIEFPKNKRLLTLLNILHTIPEEAKVIIWCKYIYSAELIANKLEVENPNLVCKAYGNTKNKSEEIEKFKTIGKYLVATIATAGYGLNLVEASYAVFYENTFKYADRIQAEDRIHRIGQIARPTYIDIYADCGIEKRIETAIISKENTADGFRRRLKHFKDLDEEQLKRELEKLL